MSDLFTAIADARSDAQALRRMGNDSQAAAVERMIGVIAYAAEPFTTWLSEDDAMLRSGDSERTLRRRFRSLLECGLARYGHRNRREYMMCAVPQRADVGAAYDAGRRAAS
jgi:AraC-like DNA-binding protein